MASRTTLDDIRDILSGDSSLREALRVLLLPRAADSGSVSSQHVSSGSPPWTVTSQSGPSNGTQIYQEGRMNTPFVTQMCHTGRVTPLDTQMCQTGSANNTPLVTQTCQSESSTPLVTQTCQMGSASPMISSESHSASFSWRAEHL